MFRGTTRFHQTTKTTGTVPTDIRDGLPLCSPVALSATGKSVPILAACNRASRECSLTVDATAVEDAAARVDESL